VVVAAAEEEVVEVEVVGTEVEEMDGEVAVVVAEMEGKVEEARGLGGVRVAQSWEGGWGWAGMTLLVSLRCFSCPWYR
jgi:hypothetical protein